MVKDFQSGDDTNASFYAGLLVSAFAVAEACTAMTWGTISDRYGRKPIVLTGLAGTALSSLLFGFAANFWVALAARVVGGLLNGNVAVMQTMVAEMCKKPEWERKWTNPYGTQHRLLTLCSQGVRHAAIHVVTWNDYRSRDGRLPGATCPLLPLVLLS
jgi:MFS family permease